MPTRDSGATSGAATWSTIQLLRSPVAIALLAVAVIARASYTMWAHIPWQDASLYHDLARHLVDAGAYRTDLEALPRKSPGYPFFVAAVYLFAGPRPYAVYAVQHVLDIVGACLVVDLARRLRLSRGVAFVAFAIALFDPFTVAYASTLLSEALATLLTTVGILLAVRIARGANNATFAAYGACMSACALVKPAFAVVPAVQLLSALVVGKMDVRRWLRGTAVAAAVYVAVWSPWVVRNYVQFHRFIPYHAGEASATPGYNRWASTWVIHLYDMYGAYFDDPPNPAPRAYETDSERREVLALIARRGPMSNRPPPDEAAGIDARFGELADERIARHPFRHYVVNTLLRSGAMWFTRETTVLAQANTKMTDVGRARWGGLALKGGLLLIMLALPTLMALGVVLLWRRGTREIAIVVAVAVTLTAVIQYMVIWKAGFLIAAEPRYVIECFPALGVAASVAAVAIAQRLKSLVRRRPA